MDKIKIYSLFEFALRFNVFIKLFIYGMGKIVGGQFYLKGSIPDDVANITLGETEGYELAWTFFGYSKGYIIFIGFSQLVGAFLFLFNKTKLVGGAILIPILLNIIVVDYFYGVAYGAMFSACFYLASVFLVMWMRKDLIIEAIQHLWIPKGMGWKKDKILVFGLITILCFTAIFFVELFGIQLFGYEDR